MEPNALSNKIRILAKQYFIQKITIGRGVYYYINQKIKEDYQDELDETVALEKLKKEQLAMIEDVDYDENHILTKAEKEILQKVIENPGLSNKELAKALQMKVELVEVRTRVLRKHNFIQRIKKGGILYYYINQKVKEDYQDGLDETVVLEKLKKEKFTMMEDVEYDKNHKITEREKKILQKVIENPGLSHKELASTLQMKQTALSNKVQILAKHHLIRVVYLGRNHYYYINKDFEENGKDALREKSVETAIKKRNRVGEKEVYPSTLLVSLIKNILTLSTTVDAQILFNYYDVFQYYFSLYEQIQLLYLLNICQDNIFSFAQLFETEIPFHKSIDKKDLLLRYEEVCIYLSQHYEEDNQKVNIKSILNKKRQL